MRELGGKLWGLVGRVVDVIRWGVERDSGENSNGFNLGETWRSAQAKDADGDLGYLGGDCALASEIESADGGHFEDGGHR